MATQSETIEKLDKYAEDTKKVSEAYDSVLTSEGEQDVTLYDGRKTPNLNKRLAGMAKAVSSVNGKTGAVKLTREDFDLPSDEYLARLEKEARFVITSSGRTQEDENKDFMTSVNDYAELSVLKAEDGRVAKVKNFGISGDFIFKAGSTLSPDGFNVVEGIGGKWLRFDARVINIGNQLLNLPESFAQNSASKSLIAIGVDNFHATQQAILAIAIGNGNFKDTQIVPHNNIAIGSDCMWALVNSTPYYNQSDYRGTRNIAIGGNVMSFLTTGHGNVAIGRGAGQPMTTGSENTIIGHGANGGRTPIGLSGKIENGSPNPANRNTFVGSFTGHKYIGGGSNTLVGAYAGNNLKLATTSVVIGNSCMEHYESNIDPIGYDLLWSGSEACTYTQTGAEITLNVTSNHGAQVGAFITFRLLDGDAKTFLNDPALGTVTAVTASSIKITSPKSYNTSGNALLLSVASLTRSVTNGSEFVAIGGSVGGTTIENARRSVMIGHTVAFQAKNTSNSVLIGENAVRYGADFTSTVAIGSNSLNSTSSEGANNVATRCTAIGVGAMGTLVDGSKSYNIDVSSAFGAFARVSGSNQVQIGGPTTTTYTYGAVQDRSDIRDKTDIEDMPDSMTDFILNLNAVQGVWDMRDDYVDDLFPPMALPTKESYPTKPEKPSSDAFVFTYDDGLIINRTDLHEEALKQYELELASYHQEVDRIDNEYAALKAEYERKSSERDAKVREWWSNPHKDGSKKRTRKHNWFIAQEVKALADKLGVDFAGLQDHKLIDGTDTLTIGYEEFIPPIVATIQKLNKRLDDIESRLSKFE